MGSTHAQEVATGERFRFGRNWSRFLTRLNDERIEAARQSLGEMLQVDSLAGSAFLDIGSGSGLFSLAARRLGADVTSFDFDPESVACTAELRRRYFADDTRWRVEQGSVLDGTYMRTLGEFDVVYSWGVLHHTGQMWSAVDEAMARVKPGGRLFIALYNHQPVATPYWTMVKRSYNRWPLTRPLWVLAHLVYPTLPSLVVRSVRNRRSPRGMSVWYDLLDWLGGYPFEVARPEEVFDRCVARGFRMTRLKTVGGRMGCNEFVFVRERSA